MLVGSVYYLKPFVTVTYVCRFRRKPEVSGFSGQGVGVRGKDVVWLREEKSDAKAVWALNLLDFAGNERIVH